jgi:hypothetical protein
MGSGEVPMTSSVLHNPLQYEQRLIREKGSKKSAQLSTEFNKPTARALPPIWTFSRLHFQLPIRTNGALLQRLIGFSGTGALCGLKESILIRRSTYIPALHLPIASTVACE